MTFRSAPGGFGRSPGRMSKAGGPSVPSFDPTTLFSGGEQGLWYDPSNFTTMFQDAAKTTPVTAVGQPVGAINDISGRGNHATQVTSTSRPVLQQDGGGRYYLAFDGVDDFLVTGSIDFTVTDKMTTWIGLRKGADAAFAPVIELSASLAANNGTFYIATPNSATPSLGFATKGTTQSLLVVGSGWAAPVSLVLTGQADIAAPSGVFRANGGQIAANAISQGTGTYGNYPIYIGRRAGTSSPFTGSLYSLIVRGAASNAGQITGAESYVNFKTGAF